VASAFIFYLAFLFRSTSGTGHQFRKWGTLILGAWRTQSANWIELIVVVIVIAVAVRFFMRGLKAKKTKTANAAGVESRGVLIVVG
jgi:hypothetical protein